MTPLLERRAAVLRRFGADSATVAELLAYDDGRLSAASREPASIFPLPTEEFVATWTEYARDVAQSDLLVLAPRLLQLQFPIGAGVSATADYLDATRRGIGRPAGREGGLRLVHSERCRIEIHPTWAGEIPIIYTGCRDDFTSLVRAFCARNEPVPIPDALGACVVAGYINWDRVARLRERWICTNPDQTFSMARIAHLRDSYRDRFIILSDGDYSGVPAARLGLAKDDWRRISLVIRREHECAHYWTRRVLSSMGNRALDEVVADYCGIVAAHGEYRADWFLAFMGIERAGCLATGRLHQYRGTPPVSDRALGVMQQLLIVAAAHLETFDRALASTEVDERLILAMLTITRMTLEDLAAADAPRRLIQDVQQQRQTVQLQIRLPLVSASVRSHHA